MVELLFERRAARRLRKLPPDVRTRIMEALGRLAAGGDPPVDVRRLIGADAFRLRVGKWRIIFDYDDYGNIRVLDI